MTPTRTATESPMSTKITTEIVNIWTTRNDQGTGSPAGEEGMTCREAAIDEGYTILDERSNDGDEVLCRTQSGRLVLICDANGPWAIYVD